VQGGARATQTERVVAKLDAGVGGVSALARHPTRPCRIAVAGSGGVALWDARQLRRPVCHWPYPPTPDLHQRLPPVSAHEAALARGVLVYTTVDDTHGPLRRSCVTPQAFSRLTFPIMRRRGGHVGRAGAGGRGAGGGGRWRAGAGRCAGRPAAAAGRRRRALGGRGSDPDRRHHARLGGGDR
jgi:hypothetical protein